MGGSICIAIREENGTEHSAVGWTNMLPWMSASPEFYDKGEIYQKCIDHHETLDSVQFYSYGYVLYDFKDKHIISCNGYFYPGLWSFIQPDKTDFEQIAEMHKRGMITTVYKGGLRSEDDYFDILDGKPPKNGEENLQALLNWHKNPDAHHYFIVKYNIEGWTIITVPESEDERRNATAVREYCKAHGWRMEVFGDPDEDEEEP